MVMQLQAMMDRLEALVCPKEDDIRTQDDIANYLKVSIDTPRRALRQRGAPSSPCRSRPMRTAAP